MIKDIKILGVIIFISLILFGYTFTFDEVPEILAQGMQPTMMPRLIFSLIIFLCFFQIYQNKSLKSENNLSLKTAVFSSNLGLPSYGNRYISFPSSEASPCPAKYM